MDMATPHFEPLKKIQEGIHVYMKCDADKSEQRINLLAGAYRDEDGKPWVLPFVLRIENEMLRSATYNHEYILFLGLDLFKELVPPVVLGENSPALKSGRAFGIQTASGTSALRIGAELLVRHAKYTTFYTSEQTWDQHEATLLYAGFSNSRQYRYWDPVKRGVDFDGMVEDLRQAPENSVIILQACAHNPTGCDLTKEQWIKVADIVQDKKLFPFFDIAYQGFASGDMEEDAWPVRYFVDRGIEMLIAQSFSKNLGLYGDRVGSLIVVLKDGRQKEFGPIKLMLTMIARALYLVPTRHGGEIVIQTLQDATTRKEWFETVQLMVKRLQSARQGLKERLEKLGTPGNWNHITEQKGMFSFTGLTRKQSAYLADNCHMYILPNGRINVGSLNRNNLDRFAQAVNEAILNVPDHETDTKLNTA